MRPLLLLAALGLLLLFLTLTPPALRAAADPAIDWAKARQLHERDLRGEQLTAEDKAFLDRARALVRAGRGPGAGNAATRPAPAPATPTGLIPLPELGDKTYKGQTGGLYGDGKNQPPSCSGAPTSGPTAPPRARPTA